MAQKSHFVIQNLSWRENCYALRSTLQNQINNNFRAKNITKLVSNKVLVKILAKKSKCQKL